MSLSRRAFLAHSAALGALAAGCSGATGATDALGDSDAVGLAARIGAGEITAADALNAAIARAEGVNGQLNFIAAPIYDYARERVGGPLSGPFAGVPTLIKDLMPIAGQPTHYGCRAFADNVADAHPPYVDALLAAGVVPFAKSTTPEFGLTATTEPALGGPTKNPWDLTRSCGGSSGGAAVAVAARVVPIAHASDGGGSIRIPASCNGVFGLKPSRDRTIIASAPDRGLSISVNGCVSISVRDTAAWLAATEQTGDAAALAPVGLVEGPNTQRLRIRLAIADARGADPDADVRAATEAVAELCRSLGHEVSEGALAINGAQFADDFTLLWAAGAAEIVATVRQRAGDAAPLDQVLEPLTLELAQRFAEAPPGAIEAAIGRLRAVDAAYQAAFSDFDVLLTPVLAKTPPLLGELSPMQGLAGFERVADYVGYTPLQNVAGAPAMSVPLTWSQAGLPIGAHFSAPTGQERRLLELAYELEQAQPWAARKPTVHAG
jgi:amidase